MPRGISPHEHSSLRSRDVLDHYFRVRGLTDELCRPLEPEDCVIQSMPDASPTRWHLAHTTWFFETFVLARYSSGYEPYDSAYAYLFNSYYNSVGDQYPRPQRGLLSRPTMAEVHAYRAAIDERMEELLEALDDRRLQGVAPIVELGLHHEQQHQELILTDVKHVFSCNPLYPAYHDLPESDPADVPTLGWVGFDEGLREIGHAGDGFAYDNESPRHRVFLEEYELGDRLITNADYLEFMDDGGYRHPTLWLSEGWQAAQQHGWDAPLYWVRRDGVWWQFTTGGLRPLDPAEPVCHVSYYEADALARWFGARLPTEAEWEFAVADREIPIEGNFVEDGRLHPRAVDGKPAAGFPEQMFGDLWEWTASPYTPYPGYMPPEGALGEYNGKFMCNQFVLRGGSCATSSAHIRRTYRNFFPPHARWQFTGIRLAQS